MFDHVGKTFIGKEFNKIYFGKNFYKLTKKSENHFGFKFVDGINIDTYNFIPAICKIPSGLHFTDIKNLPFWTDYKTYIRKVTIPDDAIVYVGYNMFKADKIFLHERILLKDFELWDNLEFQKNAINCNACHLKFIKNPSDLIQKMAVRLNGYSIYYIKDPSLEIQKLALCENIYSYYYIKNPNEKIINFLKIICDDDVLFHKIISKNTDPLKIVCDTIAIDNKNNPISENKNNNENKKNNDYCLLS